MTEEDDDVLAGNPVLIFLVETTALAAVPIELTVLVNGTVVSGRLRDEFTYVHRQANRLQQTKESQPEQTPVQQDLAAALRDQIRGLQPGAVFGSEYVYYVYLEQVRIARGSGEESHVALLRGSVEDITGWGFGERRQTSSRALISQSQQRRS